MILLIQLISFVSSIIVMLWTFRDLYVHAAFGIDLTTKKSTATVYTIATIGIIAMIAYIKTR